jgi:hypothetical protein
MLKAKPATAKGYIKALRSTHVERGLDTSVFNDPRTKLVLRGGKRVYGEGEKRLRLPLTARSSDKSLLRSNRTTF